MKCYLKVSLKIIFTTKKSKINYKMNLNEYNI